jgi:hypothetical protein
MRWRCWSWPRAPSRVGGSRIPELVDALGQAGRRRQVDARAGAIRTALASQQLEAPAVVAAAYGQVVTAAVACGCQKVGRRL